MSRASSDFFLPCVLSNYLANLECGRIEDREERQGEEDVSYLTGAISTLPTHLGLPGIPRVAPCLIGISMGSSAFSLENIQQDFLGGTDTFSLAGGSQPRVLPQTLPMGSLWSPGLPLSGPPGQDLRELHVVSLWLRQTLVHFYSREAPWV